MMILLLFKNNKRRIIITLIRHDPYLPSDPAAFQTLGRVEYATIHAVAPPDSRIVTPLILTLFSHRLLDVQKFDSECFQLSSHRH